ncbi:hypothetical protein WN943_015383 [Citrus x changshan-huyou]
MSELNRMYGVRVNKENLYRAKKIALESGGADFESSYRLIRSYAQMILNKMPDALAIVHVSRSQKRIQNALRLEYPNAHVRYCARHLLANLKSKHPIADFKGGFWEAARASNQIDFEIVMEKVKSADVATYETLRRVHPRLCSRHAFDRTSKFDHCTNNMTESFNA